MFGRKLKILSLSILLICFSGQLFALEEYVRKFGHFNLVEVEEKDGTKVIIRV